MSPKNDNQQPEAKPGVTVNIPHDREQTPSAPSTAPPLPQLEPLPVRPINITDTVPTPPPTTPVVPPVLQHEFHEHEGRRWPVVLVYTALAFLVAVAVVFAGRWVYQKVTQKPKPAPTAGNNQGQAPAPPASSQPITPSPSGQPGTGGELPNNGPGDVAAIFVGTALVVGGLHFLYSLRKRS